MNNSADIGKVVLIGPESPQSNSVTLFIDNLAGALRRKHPCTQILVASAIPVDERASSLLNLRPGHSIQASGISLRTARLLSNPELAVDVVSFQHHYDLPGGEGGNFVLPFLDALMMPVVTTVHDLAHTLSRHTPRSIMHLLGRSDRIVVTREEDRTLLHERHGTPMERIDVIPAPAKAATLRDQVAARMGDSSARSDRTSERPGTPAAPPPGAGSWDFVAERYNQSFLRAIVDPRPAKKQAQHQPWPWVRRREFSAGEGCTPGWDG